MTSTISDISNTIDKYLHNLGLLVITYSDMENWMKGFASHLINPKDDTGRILTGDMPFKPLREKLMSLYREKQNDSALVERFEILLKKIDGLATRRNDMIHSVWHFTPLIKPDQLAVWVKASAKFKGFKVEKIPTKTTDIDELTKEIDQASKGLIGFILNWQDSTIVI